MEKVKAIVYYRMSSEQQEDSIPKQRVEIERIKNQFGYEIVAEYIDDGLSGSKNTHKRKDYLQMISDIQNGAIDGATVLLLWKTSRFSRENPLEAAQFYRVLQLAKIDIHDTQLGRQDLNTQMGRIMVMFQSEQNHAYSLEISDNSSGGRRTLANKGWWVAGSIPYGFDKVYVSREGDKTLTAGRRDFSVKKPRGWRCKLVKNEQESVWVQYIFDAYANRKLSLRKIAEYLNQHGVLVPSGSPDKGWTKDNLRDMLRNKAYCGYVTIGNGRRLREQTVFNRIGSICTKSSNVSEIVSEELWNDAVGLLNRRSKAPYLHVNGGFNAWRGVCFCGHCGYALDRKTRLAKGNQRGFLEGNRYSYFTCCTSVKQPGKGQCKQWRVLEDELEEIVLGHLVSEIDAKILRSLELQRQEIPENPQRDILQKKLDKLLQLIEVATDRWLKAPESMMEAAERKVREYQEEAKRLEDQIAVLDLKECDLERLQSEWQAKKEEFLLIDERVTFSDNENGGMFPQRMRRVRAKIEKDRFAQFLTDLGFRVSFYWQPIQTNPKRVRHQSRKTIYRVDRAKVNSRVLPPNSKNAGKYKGSTGLGGSYQYEQPCAQPR